MFKLLFVSQLKSAVRTKRYLFWTLLFPIALGSLFFFAFGKIYDQDKSEVIPVTVICDNPSENENYKNFTAVLEGLQYDDGTNMVEIKDVEAADTQTATEKAEELLKDEDIDGIIFVSGDGEISLKIAENSVSSSILTNVINTYKQKVDILTAAMEKQTEKGNSDPAELQKLMEEITESTEYTESIPLAGENKDPFVQYFYNLIAMISIMGSMSTLAIVIDGQANQSTRGIRIDASPVNKIKYELILQLAAVFVQEIIIVIALLYYTKVLGINFGGDMGLVYLTSMLSTLLGCSLGFLVGHIGKFSRTIKENILMTIILGGGFLSGLMYGDMKAIIEENCPIINRINPSAVISDAFISLNLFGVGKKYYYSIFYVMILTVIFTAIGLTMSRRKQYASL